MIFGTKHLFLDSRVVDRIENVRLVLGRVEKDACNPLFIEDKPWEVRFDNLYPNVIFDDMEQLYKAWYNPYIVDEVSSATPLAKRKSIPYDPYLIGKVREAGVCYATSRDGIVWEKPELGIIEFDGSKRNNLVMRGVHGVGIKKDLHDPDPARRYKALLLNQLAETVERNRCGVATSPDGLHWAAVTCPEIGAEGNSHNNFIWDDRQGKYIGITRLWDGDQRLVGRTESADFRRWTRSVEILRAAPDAPQRQTYAMTIFRYADVYLGLLMIFGRIGETMKGTVDCELAWSPDSLHWERLCAGTPLIQRGPAGSFDSGCIFGAASPIIRENEVRLYYAGSDGLHGDWRNGGFGLTRLRPDRFAGLSGTGIVVTKPIRCTGKRLWVTADAAGGVVRAAVLGHDAFSLSRSRPISADVTDGLVNWRSSENLAALSGTTIELVFELNHATIYAFGFD